LSLNSITGCKPPRRRGGDHIVGNDENGIEAGLIFSDVKEANGIMQVVDAVPTPRPADDCSDTSSQASLDLCANRNFQRSDAELNVLYKRIAERLKDNKETAALLIKAEVAWVSNRFQVRPPFASNSDPSRDAGSC
jgi:hypothetical protein